MWDFFQAILIAFGISLVVLACLIGLYTGFLLRAYLNERKARNKRYKVNAATHRPVYCGDGCGALVDVDHFFCDRCRHYWELRMLEEMSA